ncbi:hypothetical protein ACVW1C_003393 [Bradyrhizobium sp. USDA 4011]
MGSLCHNVPLPVEAVNAQAVVKWSRRKSQMLDEWPNHVGPFLRPRM